MDRITVADVIKAKEMLENIEYRGPILTPEEIDAYIKEHTTHLPPGEYYIVEGKNEDDSLRRNPKPIRKLKNMRQLRNKKRKR